MRYLPLVALLALLLLQPAAPASKIDHVRNWATALGDELWRLNEALTNSSGILKDYKLMNASVKKKNGTQILDSSLRSVSTMLTRKINAVKCIHATAKRLAKEFAERYPHGYVDPPANETEDNSTWQYCSAKYSWFEYETPDEKPEVDEDEEDSRPRFANAQPSHYLNVSLEKDSHFYDINVNTNLSCVHVPTNIFYLENDTRDAIIWTKGLNEVFLKNYQSDPSLSWQYFGTSNGILRFYPGMPWYKTHVDTYDCRVRTWYIEAATCSKDVIILFDVSGSMTGFKNYVARYTLKTILSTLSNNDFVNVLTFKNLTAESVSCFKGLVQATPENIETIKDALEPRVRKKKDSGTNTGDNKTGDKPVEDEEGPPEPKVPLEGNANLTLAYITAFNVLREKRDKMKCHVTSSQGCNQMVMVITDYVPGNLTEVFEEYNREVVDNKTYIPVRVFTFLIGKEVTNVKEIQSMACTNRGYFVHIHSVEEVQQQVLKYINVIARPMVLAKEDPPPTWTHANIDETRTKEWKVSGDLTKQDEDKLVTSVAIPAFHSDDSNENATLLGVAGTDVPIDSIAKLAQPHQLGVNGYPLIVSNNGFLLLHPLLVATLNDELQSNFNSVDFVEVEQVDDGKGPRELGEKIIQLRQHLVDGDSDSMTGVEVLFHYDKMRRIARVQHDYFFNKLEGTPFSMGISLPVGYGDTELTLNNNPLEATFGQDLTGVNVTDYFRTNFRVHPDWVYCKYHYLEGHEANTTEIEIWRFLVKNSHGTLDITKQQYSQSTEANVEVDSSSSNCDARTQLDKDDYYCTEDLVKQLVFDAKLTHKHFGDWNVSPYEWELARKYNVSVRFIATSSGLTRWHYVFEDDKNEYVDDHGNIMNYTENVFGEIYHNAIEETWYKAAVLQHMIKRESLVIATKLPILDKTIQNEEAVINDDGDITITTSYALFYKDGDSETPASVVGSQYSYLQFYERFNELIKTVKPARPIEDFYCGSNFQCYLVDSSGYVVLTSPQNITQVGLFFGAIDISTSLVMQQFIDRNVFQYVEVFNYQALCPSSLLQDNAAWSLTTPFSLAGNFMRWLFTELVLLILNWNQYSYADNDTDYPDIINKIDPVTTTAAPVTDDPDKQKKEAEETFSCDHSIKLYILNQSDPMRTIFEDEAGECYPPFWASYVRNTNLLLVVVEQDKWDAKEGCPTPPTTAPNHTESSTTSHEPCHKLDLGSLPRRRLEGCFTYHDKENNITVCGKGNTVRGDLVFLSAAALLASLTSRLLSS